MANDLTPATRVEKLLAEILGEDYAVIPVTRIEKFLSNILGAEYDLIPATRIEKFLAKIAEEGGGGGVKVESGIFTPTAQTHEVSFPTSFTNNPTLFFYIVDTTDPAYLSSPNYRNVALGLNWNSEEIYINCGSNNAGTNVFGNWQRFHFSHESVQDGMLTLRTDYQSAGSGSFQGCSYKYFMVE